MKTRFSHELKFPAKILLLMVFIIIIFPVIISSQNLLNRPESVVYDSVYNRYLVSNWTNGSIVQIDSNLVQSYFVTGHGSINGITISGNTVFAACSTKIKGFDLTTKDTVMDLRIPGAINLNDPVADNSGNLYITDFNARKIMKVNIATHDFTTFVDGLTLSPNGLLFEEDNNRLLLCSFGNNIPILAINIEDSTVSTIAYTLLSNCDGIAKDDYGNYYISSWATLSIYKYDSNFSHPPEMFYSNNGAPVDISYNNVDDVLAVPLMNANSVEFIPITPVSVDEEADDLHLNFKLNQNYPNPFNPTTRIKFLIPTSNHVVLKVFDLIGNEVATLVNERKPAGEYEINFDASSYGRVGLPSGIYFYSIVAGEYRETRKMILLR